MHTLTTILAHGLEGSPKGKKATALREAGIILDCPDCRGLVLAERIEKIRPLVEKATQVLLVGSSYGGLVALYHASHFPQKIVGMVLCAPAFHHQEAPMVHLPPLPPSVPCVLIHGIHDTIVPLSSSERFVQVNPHVELLPTDDDHRLSKSLGHIIRCVKTLGGLSPFGNA